MSSPNEDWYSHLVAQSRNDNIYTLIHSFLTPDLEFNHDLDFVVVRRSQLPAHLQKVPPAHISKKLLPAQYCFPGNDYILLHNYKLTEYLYAARWANVIEDFEDRNFIELRYDWTEEAQDCKNDPPAYHKGEAKKKLKAAPMPIQSQPPQSDDEAALIASYELLHKGTNKEKALQYAERGKIFLDAQQITVNENSAETLHQLARRMMGYNIVAMVYSWNDKIDKAAAVDALYIHHPPIWNYLDAQIQSYLEMLMVKKQTDYLHHLFADLSFRKQYLGHYEAFISLFVNDHYELTRMGEVVNIINRVNNSSSDYR